jgi:hypothetical protein
MVYFMVWNMDIYSTFWYRAHHLPLNILYFLTNNGIILPYFTKKGAFNDKIDKKQR